MMGEKKRYYYVTTHLGYLDETAVGPIEPHDMSDFLEQQRAISTGGRLKLVNGDLRTLPDIIIQRPERLVFFQKNNEILPPIEGIVVAGDLTIEIYNGSESEVYCYGRCFFTEKNAQSWINFEKSKFDQINSTSVRSKRGVEYLESGLKFRDEKELLAAIRMGGTLDPILPREISLNSIDVPAIFRLGPYIFLVEDFANDFVEGKLKGLEVNNICCEVSIA